MFVLIDGSSGEAYICTSEDHALKVTNQIMAKEGNSDRFDDMWEASACEFSLYEVSETPAV